MVSSSNGGSGDAVTFLAVGDVFLDRPQPDEAFAAVRDVFAAADVVVGNCEGSYGETFERAPSSAGPLLGNVASLEALGGSGITVIGLANNHIVDGGYSAMLGTRDSLRAAGVATAGAGENLPAAREPALVEASGRTIAVLAYSSVFPHGYEARPGVPGLAPLRAFNLYTPWEPNDWDPGMLPRVTTVPHKPDEAAFAQDIAAARERADVVVVSVHWGDFTRPFVLTDHERRTAYAAIDAGADAVLGHHHHLLRGIESYNGKPIFYGLSHFAFDIPNVEPRIAEEGYLLEAIDPDWIRGILRRFGEYRLGTREGYPLLPFHEDSRMTAIAVLRFQNDGVTELGLIPCILGPENSPQPVDPGAPEGQQVMDYLNRCCAEEGLAASFESAGMTVGPAAALTVRVEGGQPAEPEPAAVPAGSDS